MADAEAAVKRQLKLAIEEATPEDLAKVKQNAKYRQLLSLDTPAAVAGHIGWTLRRTGDLGSFEAWSAAYEAVTLDDLAAVLESSFVDEGLTVATLVHAPEPAPEDDAPEEVQP